MCCSFFLKCPHTARHIFPGDTCGGRRLHQPHLLTPVTQANGEDNDMCPPVQPPPVLYDGRHWHSDAEFATLQRRVRVLERMVGDLCGALMYSDNMFMMEQNSADIGLVYRDASFGEARQQVFARQRIQQVLESYGFSAKTQPHCWVLLNNNSTISNVTNTSAISHISE